MMQSVHPRLTPALMVLLTALCLPLFANEEAPPAQTIDDPGVPVDELTLLLKPLTREQLLVEADAWQGLLAEKAKAISALEIQVARGNREIEAAEEASELTDELNEELEAAEPETEATKPGLDADAAAEIEDARKEIEETEQELDQRLEDVPLDTDAENEARTAYEDADSIEEKREALARTAAIAESITSAGKEAKVTLLEHITTLREERAALVDRLEAVLDSLERKTDEGDADTLKRITDFRLYSRAVSGIEVDVEDTASMMIALKGWVLSDEGGKRWAINIAKALGILLIAWVVSGIVSSAIRHTLGRVPGTSRLLEKFLVTSVRWIVMAIGFIMALSALEVSIGPLLALVGAAGFVVAFALQDSLSNFASGLMILFFRPFDEGDGIDAGGVAGKVQSMNLVSTTILTFDNKRMIVPNNKIWNDVITNITGVTERRVDMEFGIGYDDDVDRAAEILNEIVASHPKVLDDPEPTIRMHALADSSVNFIVRPWARTADYWDVNWDITRAVKKRFDEAGIGIPFPQRDIHLYLADDKAKAALASSVTPEPSSQHNGSEHNDGGLDDGDDHAVGGDADSDVDEHP